MAHVYKTASGWRAQIARKGQRLSRTFATKAAATLWAAREEAAILDGTASRWPAKTLADALDRYEREVTPGKRSKRFEAVAFGLTRREHPDMCAKIMHTITAQDLAHWRDKRLKHVSGSTVQRYAALLRNVWTVAAREWGWCPEPSPWRGLRLPAHNPARDKLIGWREARAILRRLNYFTGLAPANKTQEVAYAFLLGLRTAMRASEIVGLTGRSVDLSAGVVTLERHKTREATGRARHVPLTPAGVRLLRVLHKPGPLFTVKPASLDALFRKARDQVMVEGVHFHDSRATALTHLARRVDVLTLARISGHRDISQLMMYYRETAADISQRMASPKPRLGRGPTRPTSG